MLKVWSVAIPQLTGTTRRRAYVYVPDSFKKNPDLRYPVLYMFDGHNVFYDKHATYGKSWGMLQYLKKARTQIIVAAVECNRDSNNGRLHEYSPFPCYVPALGEHLKGKGHVTMDWYVKQFKPYVDQHFPTISDRDHTFIAGSSMGGLMSLYAISKYNRYFSRCAALSPSIWFGYDKLAHLLRTAPLQPNTSIYLDYGADEIDRHSNMLKTFGDITSLLMQRGVGVTSRIILGGNHSEGSWEKQIPIFMDALLYHLNEEQ